MNKLISKMTSMNVKSLLFISSEDKTYSHCFLFHCAKYWADQGDKVLYISHEPMENLPKSIGRSNAFQNLESFSLIRFLYLPKWQDLLKQCYSVHLQHNPASVIIVQGLENYCISDTDVIHDHTSLICASLLQAASVCAIKNSKPSHLINAYYSKNSVIPKTMSKSFFHNIWELSIEKEEVEDLTDRKFIKLTNLSQTHGQNGVKLFLFSDIYEQSFISFESVLESVIQLY